MKNIGHLILVFLTLFASCKKIEVDEVKDLKCNFTAPAKTDHFIGDPVTITAAIENITLFSHLEFYVDNWLILTSSEYEFSYVWNTDSLRSKTYEIRVLVYDIEGNYVNDRMNLNFTYRDPVLGTLPADDIGYHSAKLIGIVEETHSRNLFYTGTAYTDDMYRITTGVGICYNRQGNPVPDEDETVRPRKDSYYEPGDSIIVNLEKLVSGEKYYFRSFYRSATEIYYGPELTFETDKYYSDLNTFSDERDGRIYSTARYGDQVWMTENLAYCEEVFPPDSNGGVWIAGYSGFDVEVARALLDDDRGVLYSQEKANEVCPSGWHLPSDSEWKELETYLGAPDEKSMGDRMKTEDFEGTNEYRFNVKLTGYRNASSQSFGEQAVGFWSSDNGIYRAINFNPALERRTSYSDDGFSVRCVSDE